MLDLISYWAASIGGAYMHGEYEYEEGVKYSINNRGGSTLPASVMLVALIILRVLSISSSSGCNSG